MRKLILCISLLSGWAYGQTIMPSDSAMNDSSKVTLSLDLEGTYGGNGLRKQFLSKLLYGGLIDSLDKTVASNGLGEANFMAGEINSLISAHVNEYGLFDKDHLGWYVALGHTSLARIDFHRDLFDLIFYGNQPFQGGSANLGMELQAMSFQKLLGGVNNERRGWHAGLGIYKGGTLAYLNTENSYLYTANDASYIDLGLNSTAQFSDTASSGFGAVNGLGFGIDLAYEIRVDNHPKVRFSLEDFGWMFWNKSSTNISKDTLYNYQGFDIYDLIGGTTPSLGNLNDTLGLTGQNGSIRQFMPFRFRIEKPLDPLLDNTIQIYYGLSYRHYYQRIPELYFGAGYHPSESSYIHAALGYGGYYGAHLRAGLELIFSAHAILSIESLSMLNTVSHDGFGQSVLATIRGRF